jgi:hypothetical protein
MLNAAAISRARSNGLCLLDAPRGETGARVRLGRSEQAVETMFTFRIARPMRACLNLNRVFGSRDPLSGSGFRAFACCGRNYHIITDNQGDLFRPSL